MQGAVTTADRVVTVSPTYAHEIQTSEGGWGLEYVLGGRSMVLNGVLNGIDVNEWNPAVRSVCPRWWGLGAFFCMHDSYIVSSELLF